jgi:transcription elongation factor GreA
MDENNKYQTTASGLQKLKEELKDREENQRSRIASTLNEMRNQGDLRENDGYTMAIEEQNINEERILELKEKIRNAVIIKDRNKSKVGIGDTVHLKGEKSLTYEIVGQEEANPLDGKISSLSPIGQAVINKKVGDKVTISTPKGDTTYILDKIS